MKIWNKKILNKAATFLLTAVLLCCSVMPVKAENLTQIEYLYIGDDVLTVEIGVTDCPEEWLEEDENSSGGNNGNGNIINDPYIDNLSYTYPLMIEQKKSENGNYYTTSYKVYETFTITNLGTDITVRGGLVIGHNIGCYVFDFYDNVDDDINFFHVVSSIKGIKINNVNDKVVLCTFGGSGPLGRIDNVNEGIMGEAYSQYNVNICDYFPGPVNLQATVEYEVTVYSSTNDFKFTFTGDDIDILSGAFDITSGNTLSDADLAFQNTLIKIQQSTSNIESLQQQGNTLQQEANKQSSEQHNEIINGYKDTTISEAASAFSSESDKLTALEGELSTQSSTYVSDYVAEGFDLGVLATIGSSLIFVTTWFTNFWNMGGVFTAALNFCFALSIVFFILRIKR